MADIQFLYMKNNNLNVCGKIKEKISGDKNGRFKRKIRSRNWLRSTRSIKN